MDESDPVRATSKRVCLRVPCEADRAAFSRLVIESRDHLARWVRDGVVQQDPDGMQWFDYTLAANAEGRSERLFIVRRADGTLLGSFNFNEITRGSFQSAYLGYWIGGAYVRQGFMAEALRAGLAYAFGPLGLHRVEANIQPANTPSIGLVRAAGFRFEGYSPRYLRVGGIWCDHERWAITTETWSRRG